MIENWRPFCDAKRLDSAPKKKGKGLNVQREERKEETKGSFCLFKLELTWKYDIRGLGVPGSRLGQPTFIRGRLTPVSLHMVDHFKVPHTLKYFLVLKALPSSPSKAIYQFFSFLLM